MANHSDTFSFAAIKISNLTSTPKSSENIFVKRKRTTLSPFKIFSIFAVVLQKPQQVKNITRLYLNFDMKWLRHNCTKKNDNRK